VLARRHARASTQHFLRTGSNSLEELALYIAVKGFDFQVLDPPELIPVLRALSERLRQAAASPLTAR
jgi:hypothetical protein